MSRIHSSPPFARKRAVRAILASMVVALSPVDALAEAARVTFAHGAVAATAADGARRALARGADIDAGETINTGLGRAQLRFTDGSFVSLQPNTEFRVDEYTFKGQQEPERRGFFSLLRGGLRTITGLIGRTRKASYRMRTSVATLGIRGTEYSLNFDGERLSWTVADDGKSSISIVLGNGLEQIVSSGGSGSATVEQFEALVTALQQLADAGELQDGLSPEKLLELFTAADLLPPNPVVLPPLPPPVEKAPVPPPDCSTAMPSCAIAAAFGAFYGVPVDGSETAGIYVDGGEGNLSASFAGDGSLASYGHNDGLYIAFDGGEGGLGNPDLYFDTGSNGQVNTAKAVVDGSDYFSVDAANPEDPATRATWGRWIAPPGGGASTGPNDEVHPLVFRDGEDDAFSYVISIPPPETYNTGNATYDLAGFTPPAVLGGGAAALGAPGAVTGSLTANFGAGQVQLNMTVPFANGSYSLNASALDMYARGGYTGTGKPFFKGGLSVSGSEAACVSGCDGYAAGNVFGPRADGAALGYGIADSNLSNSVITGAAVFQQKTCVGCDVAPQ